jgi:hypothetical protein
MQLLGVIQRARRDPELLPGEFVKLTASEAKILTLRHQLEREADLLEDRIVREHAGWKRCSRELARVLAEHPAAARAVADALQRLK